MELLLRSLENGNVETEQVQELQDSIKYYVEENQSVEFMEDDTIYDELNLEEDEGAFGMNNDNDRVSSQDTQSIQDDLPESTDGRGANTSGGNMSGGKPKSTSVSEPPGTTARRPSNQLKSPLPALATLHTPLANTSSNITNNVMKPAPLPTRAPGETLKYASAAAAAAASDKNAVGIAPLPPPINAVTNNASIASNAATGSSAVAAGQGPRSSVTTSPSAAPSLPVSVSHTPAQKPAVPVMTVMGSSSNGQMSAGSSSQNFSSSVAAINPNIAPVSTTEANEDAQAPTNSKTPLSAPPVTDEPSVLESEIPCVITPSPKSPLEYANGGIQRGIEEDESIYHLPSGLQDLIQSFEATKSRAPSAPSPSVQRLLSASHGSRPASVDAEKPRHYRPEQKYLTPRYYPQEPFPSIDEPSLYGKIDTDTLFYIFYYRQNTYQQYMAAKSLKSQSWRFHKQYQTWFQRHEEPKTITEEYEQGTYRFFDYESTWYDQNSRIAHGYPIYTLK